MQVLQKQKKFANFQHAFYIQLNVETYFIVILNCFWLNKKDHQVYLFSKI